MQVGAGGRVPVVVGVAVDVVRVAIQQADALGVTGQIILDQIVGERSARTRTAGARGLPMVDEPQTLDRRSRENARQ